MEEFSADENGELRLVKKKVTKREIPPDIKAVKMLMDDLGEPTDDDLEAERAELIKLLNETNKGETKN